MGMWVGTTQGKTGARHMQQKYGAALSKNMLRAAGGPL